MVGVPIVLNHCLYSGEVIRDCPNTLRYSNLRAKAVGGIDLSVFSGLIIDKQGGGVCPLVVSG